MAIFPSPPSTPQSHAASCRHSGVTPSPSPSPQTARPSMCVCVCSQFIPPYAGPTRPWRQLGFSRFSIHELLPLPAGNLPRGRVVPCCHGGAPLSPAPQIRHTLSVPHSNSMAPHGLRKNCRVGTGIWVYKAGKISSCHDPSNMNDYIHTH